MTAETQGIYVYGVIPADAELGDLSRGDRRTPEVQILEDGDLAAIVSMAGGDDEASVRDSVMAHARVLEAAVESAPVVPMRFGMVFPDEDTVRAELLEARHDQLARWVQALEGHVQVTLKVLYHEDALLRDIVAGNRKIARLRDATRGRDDDPAAYNDRVKLGELVNSAIEQQRQRDGAEILERLEPLAARSASEPPEKEYMALNAPFLIERQRLPEFEETLEQVAQERADRMTFRLLGPMPAYHFVSWEEPAWA
jgi:Gas vesicle synthesis protein GvpL/GvpF